MNKTIKLLLLVCLLMAAQTLSAVVFNVTVPEGTQKCYVVGAFNGWNTSSALEMTQTGPTRFQLDAPSVSSVGAGFKYICGPAWTYVEKSLDGSEVPNRTEATANDIVVRWAAFYMPHLAVGSITINATVPANTPENSVYLYGSFQEWIVSAALPMNRITDTEYTLTINDVTQFNYKLLSGRGIQFVEVSSSGSDIPDRNAATNNPIENIVVERWKDIPKTAVGVTYIPNAVSFSPLQGQRGLWVYLPPDYAANTGKYYPVTYMHDGQNIFVDTDGVGTWDVSATLNSLHAAGKEVGIIVGIDKTSEYISEFSPFTNSSFSKTGEGNLYLQAIVNQVIPYVNQNYRTLTGPANTHIMGSDMGGLISYYGALNYQHVFGKAAFLSPSFWFNKTELSSYLQSWTKSESSKMYFVAGSAEGATIPADAELLYEATKAKGFSNENIRFSLVAGGAHNNSSWGTQFREVYAWLNNIELVTNPDPDPVLAYQFMSHSGSGVACSGTEPFQKHNYHAAGLATASVEAMTYIKTVAASIKTTWYWNINKGADCSGINLFATNRSVGFSSSKNTDSWIRAVILAEDNIVQTAASSAFFRVKRADATLIGMNRTKADGTPGADSTFTVSAEVTFPTTNKNYEIRFGSVNTGSIQGSLVGSSDTYPLSVSESCTKALIIYSFLTNKVTVVCLESNDPAQHYQFMSHSGSGVSCTGNEAFTPGKYYATGTTNETVDVMSYVKTVPTEVKSAWNWNINKGTDCSGVNLFGTNNQVVFTSSKNTESWIRALVTEGENVMHTAASSTHFRVKKSDGTLILMSRTKSDGTPGEDNSFTVSAEVEFPGAAKGFEIRFGSVNTGSVQPSLTGTSDTYSLSVSPYCTRARIVYSFRTNLVTIVCLEDNEPLPSYQFMSHSGSGVSCSGTEPFMQGKYYATGISTNSADVMTYVKTVPVEMKSTYYWNVNRGTDCTGVNFYETNRSVGFSSSKNTESWIRVVIPKNESVVITAASSGFFRVKKSDGLLVVMTRTKSDGTSGTDDSFSVSAVVDFAGSSKNFEIRFGSVNTGSIQGSLVGSSDTYPLSVPANWTKARITYSFKTNLISMTEVTEVVVVPRLTKLSAVPSVCRPNETISVTAKGENLGGNSLSFAISHNGGSWVNISHTTNPTGDAELSFTAVSGAYQIRATASGTGENISFEPVTVRVATSQLYNRKVTVNPYANINWSTINQYKANYHLHTDWTSDASMPAHQVVDLYHSKNYRILPITNHNFSSYPWNLFGMFKSSWQDRDAQTLNMLSFPGNELSDNNHHNDFFTGRNDGGADLEESFALTHRLGGMQIINHPGQYWSIGNSYTGLQKNSPAWHADNFARYPSLVGLEVYNQGNKHPNDRILWDEVLGLTMPGRPVWGYSNDDAHHTNQAFFNYQFMLMEQLDIPTLKEAMINGKFYHSYEYGGSGNALAPQINSIELDEANQTITINTPDHEVYWISGVNGAGSSRTSAVIGIGKTFTYTGFQGNYVRAMLKNAYGETNTQPIGFDLAMTTGERPEPAASQMQVYPNPSEGNIRIVSAKSISKVGVYNSAGMLVRIYETGNQPNVELNLSEYAKGYYVLQVITENGVKNQSVILK